MIKLWHDDIRRPPDSSWVWARTNKEAIDALANYDVEEASLDHDLGFESVNPNSPGAIQLRGSSPDGSGYDLVRWMIEHNTFPERITIHSWNVNGARRMQAALRDAGHPFVVIKAYSLS